MHRASLLIARCLGRNEGSSGRVRGERRFGREPYAVHLPFPLLSDPETKMVKAYGVWAEKNMYGRKYMGVERTTFVIDGHDRISAIFRKVKPEQHVALLQPVLRASMKK
jgi:peroxiredoxin